ncbi:MAG: glycosyltransferase [Treponema sp.]|nr:glycosyltransferase [Treponema sp.]
MADRKFLFLYLDTGAGHKSAAKVLASSMKAIDPSVEIRLFRGFSRHGLGHTLFEKGYNYSCNYIHGLFPLTYDLGQSRFLQSILKNILLPETRIYLKKLIMRERPTDIVCFHFGVTPYVKEVIKTIPWKINYTVLVTDPFTVHSSWFFEKDLNYMVYSEDVKNEAVKLGVPADNIQVIPFLMNPKFRNHITQDEVRNLKIKHGFDPDKKMVLLVGGGEGLPGAREIVNHCLIHKANFSTAIICGRDKVIKQNFNLLRLANPRLDLHVFGFVDFLDELVKICDCAVIKAGPATLLEVLSCRKPVIICKYIHNQELGNVHYAINHKVGYFIQKSGAIYKKINELLTDSSFDEKMKKNFDSVVIDTDASKVAKLLLQK